MYNTFTINRKVILCIYTSVESDLIQREKAIQMVVDSVGVT